MIDMKFMIAELSEKTGLHRNTLYSLVHRRIIEPVETISNVMIFDDSTVDVIMKHYENRKLSYRQLRELKSLCSDPI